MSIPWYDGTRFAKESNIVTVTINYRLGALGFARIPKAPTSGINGILDQIAALKWVQENIENFGGDPDNVTIAGNLTVSGTTTTVNSTTVSIADPVFEIGDDSSDDNLDRGIKFKYNS